MNECNIIFSFCMLFKIKPLHKWLTTALLNQKWHFPRKSEISWNFFFLPWYRSRRNSKIEVSSSKITKQTIVNESNDWMEDYYSNIWLWMIPPTLCIHLQPMLLSMYESWEGKPERKMYTHKPTSWPFLWRAVFNQMARRERESAPREWTLTTILADVRRIRLSMNSPLAPQKTQWRTPGYESSCCCSWFTTPFKNS